MTDSECPYGNTDPLAECWLEGYNDRITGSQFNDHKYWSTSKQWAYHSGYEDADV